MLISQTQTLIKMDSFQEALLEQGSLTLRTHKDNNWSVENLSGDDLKEFVNLINVEYDESMFKVRGLRLIDLYL